MLTGRELIAEKSAAASRKRQERALVKEARYAERAARRAAIKEAESHMPPATVACMRHAGTHLIRPIVFGLGFRIVEPGYQGARIDSAIGSTILFPRDPRNRIVALCRWKLEQSDRTRSIVTRNGAATTKDAMIAATMQSEPFLADMLHWAQIWCFNRRHKSFRVTFEELAESASKAVELVGKIAHYLECSEDIERDEALVKAHFRQSPTYTGDLSRWKEWFGPESWHTWESQGGPKLLHLMGYK